MGSLGMYDPVKDGVSKSVRVSYLEASPPPDLSEVVHCFWEIKTEQDLQEDFTLHVLPDACVNILLNPLEPAIAGVTAIQTKYITLNLGRRFHYVGVQLYPGVWMGPREETVDHYVGEPYRGELPLVRTARQVSRLGFQEASGPLSRLVGDLLEASVIGENPTTSAILRKLDSIRTVADMAAAAQLSPRQLQRRLKETTGFRPHDLLKVLRIQQSFRKDVLLAFSDQAHFIHAFRQLTGYPPGEFKKIFDV